MALPTSYMTGSFTKIPQYFDTMLTANAQEWIRTTFETIEKSRNVIMHSGVLDELDVARVGMNIIDWLHQINA